MEQRIDDSIKIILNEKLLKIEKEKDADFVSFYGPIVDGFETHFLQLFEDLANDKLKRDKLLFMITTPGGSAVAVERYVNIIRKHYKEVSFIVPDYAYSAGTILCMSGDKILMDYFSVLGPIDPQVPNKEGKLVAALGYLDKVNEMIEKAKAGELTQPEFLVLKDLDLAELRGYEQAKELSIDLLKKWLVKYKFKNWDTHESTGKKVTPAEKQQRAEEIAEMLSDNKTWKSHGRPIDINTLNNDVKLKIDDYSKNKKFHRLIREYHFMLQDFILKNDNRLFFHTRKFI